MAHGGDLEVMTAAVKSSAPALAFGALGTSRHVIGGERVNSYLRERADSALFSQARYWERAANRAEAKDKPRRAKRLREKARDWRARYAEPETHQTAKSDHPSPARSTATNPWAKPRR